MLKDDDPIRRIEAELDRDRAELADALEAFKDSMTLKSLIPSKLAGLPGVSSITGGTGAKAKAEAGVDAASDVVSDLADHAGQAIKDHKASLAAAGAGAAALFALWRQSTARSDVPPAVDTRLSEMFTGRGRRRSAPSRDELWMVEADELRQKAADMLSIIEQASEAGIAPQSELDQRRREVMASVSADVRRVMSRDLGDLDDATLAKTFRARERAYAKHVGADEGGSWTKSLVIAGVVAGAGVALAYALPRSSSEDSLFGGLRDTLRDEAEKLASSDNPGLGLVGQIAAALLGEKTLAPEIDRPAEDHL